MNTELLPITRDVSPQQATEMAAQYAVAKLPSIVPSREEIHVLLETATEKTISALKAQYIDLPKVGSQAESARHVITAIQRLGGIHAIVHHALTDQITKPKEQSKSDNFRVSVWDLLVSHEYSQIDQHALLQERHPDTGLTRHEQHVRDAAHTIALARAVIAHAATYPTEHIARQLEAAQRVKPETTEEDIRIGRAQRDLKGGIQPEKHPVAQNTYTSHLQNLIVLLRDGNLTGLTDKEVQLAQKHLNSANTLARDKAQEVVKALIQQIVEDALAHEPQLAQPLYWQNILRKSAGKLADIPLSQQQERLDENLAEHVRMSLRTDQQRQLNDQERQWVTHVSDRQLTKLLGKKGIGAIPLTYEVLHKDLAKEHVVIPDMVTMVEINTRLSNPHLNAMLVLCPDYARDVHGSQVTYRFDGLSGGLGLVGEVGLPVVLPLAKRIAQIQSSSLSHGDIPTFHLRYADIEATEGNIASTRVGTRERFLQLLDQSADTLAQEVEKHFRGGYYVTRVDTPGELLQERTLVVSNRQGQPLIQFRIGALTTTLADGSPVAPSE